jgi:hypothetical protein
VEHRPLAAAKIRVSSTSVYKPSSCPASSDAVTLTARPANRARPAPSRRLIAELEAPIGIGVVAARPSLAAARPDENLHRFAVQPLEQFHQIMRRHRQIERLALIVLVPADVFQQAEVFGELQAQRLGLGKSRFRSKAIQKSSMLPR